MFGNLFRKKSRKPSKDEDVVRDEEIPEVTGDTAFAQNDLNKDDESLRSERVEPPPSEEETKVHNSEVSQIMDGTRVENDNTAPIDTTKKSVRLHSFVRLI
jgi:hypothetical protein